MGTSDAAAAILTIDLDAIAANYRLLRDRLGGAVCAAVVKADGYGLGAVPVARRLVREGCDTFFVAQPGEGIALRAALTDAAPACTIYVLNGLMPGTADLYLEHGLIPVLNHPEEAERWTRAARDRGDALPAILHVDTGMSRLGCTPADAEALATIPDRLAGIDLRYVMSHLACADDPGNAKNREQLDLFRRLRNLFPGTRGSFANSSGIFLGADYRFDMARPGAALYGVRPLRNESNPMNQVVHLQGRILQCRFIDRGQSVGYGASHLVAARTRIATVGVGYADGYLRSLGNRASAVIGGVRVPMVGRVSMDLITFDVTDLPEDGCRAGDLVDLIGPDHGIDDLADEAGTIGYEILTSFGARYERRYLGTD